MVGLPFRDCFEVSQITMPPPLDTLAGAIGIALARRSQRCLAWALQLVDIPTRSVRVVIAGALVTMTEHLGFDARATD